MEGETDKKQWMLPKGTEPGFIQASDMWLEGSSPSLGEGKASEKGLEGC